MNRYSLKFWHWGKRKPKKNQRWRYEKDGLTKYVIGDTE